MQDPADFKPGTYKHYKGDMYKALMLVHHHETRELMVVYVSIKLGSVNVREYATPEKDSWTDNVALPQDPPGHVPNTYHGSTGFVKRFEFIEP